MLGAFLVYHFTVRTIRNDRPLAGVNVDVSRGHGSAAQVSFSVDPARPDDLFGVTGDLGLFGSTDGGRHWRREGTLPLLGSSCGNGSPRTATGPDGTEAVAYLVSSPCGVQSPFLVATERERDGRWQRPVRVAPFAWEYGYDDAPALAADPRSGRLYLAWTRGVGNRSAPLVVSASGDGGRTWSRPRPVVPAADHPHAATLAVARDGDVYLAGIDARHGVWIARSGDGGRTFGTPVRAAPLRANPAAAGCALTGFSVVPEEARTCGGPSPTVVASGSRIVVVYADVGANGTYDVLARGFDRSLRPLFSARVSPPDDGRADQLFPAATVDATTGRLWACWYDTTFDPNRHRVWFTCAASRDGRAWTPPQRAASVPTFTNDLRSAAASSGIVSSVTAAGGEAHAFWFDGRRTDAQSVFTATLGERRAFRAGE